MYWHQLTVLKRVHNMMLACAFAFYMLLIWFKTEANFKICAKINQPKVVCWVKMVLVTNYLTSATKKDQLTSETCPNSAESGHKIKLFYRLNWIS